MSDTAAPTDGGRQPGLRSTPVVVLGQVARDLAVAVEAVPEAGDSADVSSRRELLGGKGANIAVGLAQLGVPVTLIGAALTWSLIGGAGPEQAVRSATAAAGLTVDHLAGRPDLGEKQVRLAAEAVPATGETRR